MKTLLLSDENYYNSKRTNSQSFQTFLRILIFAFLGAFLANTSWNSLHVPVLAYIGIVLLLITIILNIYTFIEAQNALDQVRDLTHKLYEESNITYIDEINKINKKQKRLLCLVIAFVFLIILVCPTSYIVENSLKAKEVTPMAKKQHSIEQPKQPDVKVDIGREERLWDTSSRPITPTTVVTPAQPAPESATPAQPAQPAPKPADPPAQPTPKPDTKK